MMHAGPPGKHPVGRVDDEGEHKPEKHQSRLALRQRPEGEQRTHQTQRGVGVNTPGQEHAMIHDSRDAPQSEAIILPAGQAERPLSAEAGEAAEAAEAQDLIERVWGGACTLPLDYRLVEAAALSTESRSLLDHAGSMTLRLESYWREPLRLRVLSSQQRGDYLVRLVLLAVGWSLVLRDRQQN
jgi:hypothetical protein